MIQIPLLLILLLALGFLWPRMFITVPAGHHGVMYRHFASGTVTDTERAYIDAEFQALTEEVDGIASSVRYNGESLLDGTSDFADGVSVMVGSDASDTITLSLANLSASALGLHGQVPGQGCLARSALLRCQCQYSQSRSPLENMQQTHFELPWGIADRS